MLAVETARTEEPFAEFVTRAAVATRVAAAEVVMDDMFNARIASSSTEEYMRRE
jgi:hypothetical protein